MRLLLLCGVLLAAVLPAQKFRPRLSELSRPEKCWVMLHPFAAKKARACTREARLVTDSLEKNGVLKDGNGGQLDAFRHAYWMALLVQEIPAHKAGQLGRAHEKGNYLQWKKGKLEDNAIPDSASSEMDLRNNAAGITIGEAFKSDTSAAKRSLAEQVLDQLRQGKLTIVHKDADGNLLDCDGQPVKLPPGKRPWNIPACLVPSVVVEGTD
jgi:hypothetical protein